MSLVLSLVLGVLFFPITLLGSWVVVKPQEEVVLLTWGTFRKLLTKPGLYWVNMWGRTAIRITTKKQAIDIPRSVVADGNGNPILVAGVVTFHYVDSYKAALEVEHADDYVKTQALAVLKQLCSRYPYETTDGSDSLKSEADEIGGEMVKILQSKIDVAGAEAMSFELSDLTYAPEIAGAMLVRQQAQALVDARKTIVEGAVEIVDEAVQLLKARDLELTGDERPRMIANLLTVICSDAHVQPTLPMSAGHDNQPSEHDGRIAELLEKIAANTVRPGAS